MESKKVVFKTNQKVVDAITESLKVNSSKSKSYLLESQVSYNEVYKRFGVDKFYQLSLLPNKPNMVNPDGYLLGLYRKLSDFRKDLKQGRFRK